MSTPELERELARWRSGDPALPPSGAVKLSIPEALARRDAGNLPDEEGRTLRLVLHVRDRRELSYVQQKRLLFEPDFHEAPSWRREGSKPVNVVPLRADDAPAVEGRPWWEQPELRELEQEWKRHGTIAGLEVPAGYRSFVYKTVLALRAAGREPTVDSVADSIARWLPRADAEEIRSALRAANP